MRLIVELLRIVCDFDELLLLLAVDWHFARLKLGWCGYNERLGRIGGGWMQDEATGIDRRRWLLRYGKLRRRLLVVMVIIVMVVMMLLLLLLVIVVLATIELMELNLSVVNERVTLYLSRLNVERR
jgi:hypothetical protein